MPEDAGRLTRAGERKCSYYGSAEIAAVQELYCRDFQLLDYSTDADW